MTVPWGQLLGAAIGAYGAYEGAKENEKVAERAAKGTTSTRTPYGSEMIQDMLPWIFQEAQARYAGRLGKMGIQPTDNSAAMAALGAVPSNYSGVSGQPEQFADPVMPQEAQPQGPVARPMARMALRGAPEFAEIDPNDRYWEAGA